MTSFFTTLSPPCRTTGKPAPFMVTSFEQSTLHLAQVWGQMKRVMSLYYYYPMLVHAAG